LNVYITSQHTLSYLVIGLNGCSPNKFSTADPEKYFDHLLHQLFTWLVEAVQTMVCWLRMFQIPELFVNGLNSQRTIFVTNKCIFK